MRGRLAMRAKAIQIARRIATDYIALVALAIGLWALGPLAGGVGAFADTDKDADVDADAATSISLTSAFRIPHSVVSGHSSPVPDPYSAFRVPHSAFCGDANNHNVLNPLGTGVWDRGY